MPGSTRNLRAFWGRGAMSNHFALGRCKQGEFAALRKLWSKLFEQMFLGFDSGKPFKETAQKSSWPKEGQARRPQCCYRVILLTCLSLQHSQPRGFLKQRQHLRVQQPAVDFHPVVCATVWSNFDPSTCKEPHGLYVLVQGNSFSRLFLTLPPVHSPSYDGRGNE